MTWRACSVNKRNSYSTTFVDAKPAAIFKVGAINFNSYGSGVVR